MHDAPLELYCCLHHAYSGSPRQAGDVFAWLRKERNAVASSFWFRFQCCFAAFSTPSDRIEGRRLGGLARQRKGFLDIAHQEPGHIDLPQLLSQLGRLADILGEAVGQHLRHVPVGGYQGLATFPPALKNGNLAGCAQVSERSGGLVTWYRRCTFIFSSNFSTSMYYPKMSSA